MHFNAQCRLLLDQFRPSVTSWSTGKTVRDRPIVRLLWGVYRKSPPSYMYSGNPSPSPYDHPFTQTGGSSIPQSKLASQIAAKRCQIQRWFVLTAFGNIPLPTQQYNRRPPRAPISQKGASQKIKFKTAAES